MDCTRPQQSSCLGGPQQNIGEGLNAPNANRTTPEVCHAGPPPEVIQSMRMRTELYLNEGLNASLYNFYKRSLPEVIEGAKLQKMLYNLFRNSHREYNEICFNSAIQQLAIVIG